MLKTFLLILAATLAALTSGCASALSGAPSPALDRAFGTELSEVEQYLSDSAAFVRSLDPCGFLDPADLATLGTVVQLRPKYELSTCVADVQTSTATAFVTVDASARTPSAYVPGVDGVSIGGVQVYRESSSSGSCRITFPLRDETGRAASDTLDRARTENVRTFGAVDVHNVDGDACAAATLMTESAIGMLDDPPLRADSEYDLPFATDDPCAVLAHLPTTWTVDEWSPSSDPYYCRFSVSSSTFTANNISVQLGLVVVHDDRRGVEPVTVQSGGYTVEVRDAGNFCAAEVVVGGPIASMPAVKDTRTTESVTVPVLVVLADDCESATALVVAAAETLTG